MSKDLVVKTNRLNQAFQVLTLAELHIVQLAIVDARETGTGLSTDKPLRIDAMRYAEVFGTSRQNAYQRMKEAEDTLFNRRFSFYDEDGKLVKSRWIQQVKYLDDEGAMELAFTMAVVHGISRIDGVKEFFTQYLLSQTAKLSSVYSARLYELLVQWKSVSKTPIFELNNFRDQLGIGVNEYKAMSDFKKRVLEPAIREINEQTDITASYEQHKKGRVITGFSFKFKQKPKQAQIATETPKRDQTEEQSLKPLTEPQIAKYSAILCKLGSLSELAGTMDYPTFANWLGNILRDPKNCNQETVKRVFKVLGTETDYSKSKT
ncbi:PREDICTED: replication protein-like [Habropoda laboriosa]|uniref:replication protein-like n=1 Tax=Habropoda laboriosa TaxID=597456 RepID=UPI00083D54F7|nr:PREDICTED: replication protein-like [Habropoda laboriosa]